MEDKVYLRFADRLTRLKQAFDEECGQREKEYNILEEELKRVKERVGEALNRERN